VRDLFFGFRVNADRLRHRFATRTASRRSTTSHASPPFGSASARRARRSNSRQPLGIGRNARHDLLGEIETLVIRQRQRVLEKLASAIGHVHQMIPARIRTDEISSSHEALPAVSCRS
jgi:hypothetical protein